MNAALAWRAGGAATHSAKAACIRAIVTFRKGIASLGDCYQNRDTIDDTGVRLVLAEASEKKGEIEVAKSYSSAH